MTDMNGAIILHWINKYILFIYYAQSSVVTHIQILFPNIQRDWHFTVCILQLNIFSVWLCLGNNFIAYVFPLFGIIDSILLRLLE